MTFFGRGEPWHAVLRAITTTGETEIIVHPAWPQARTLAVRGMRGADAGP